MTANKGADQSPSNESGVCFEHRVRNYLTELLPGPLGKLIYWLVVAPPAFLFGFTFNFCLLVFRDYWFIVVPVAVYKIAPTFIGQETTNSILLWVVGGVVLLVLAFGSGSGTGSRGSGSSSSGRVEKYTKWSIWHSFK